MKLYIFTFSLLLGLSQSSKGTPQLGNQCTTDQDCSTNPPFFCEHTAGSLEGRCKPDQNQKTTTTTPQNDPCAAFTCPNGGVCSWRETSPRQFQVTCKSITNTTSTITIPPETTTTTPQNDPCAAFTCSNGEVCSWEETSPRQFQVTCKSITSTTSTITVPPVMSCLPGFYLKESFCVGCPKGTYKADDGEGPCEQCPPNRHQTSGTNSTSIDECYQETGGIWPAFGPIAGGTEMRISAPGFEGKEVAKVSVAGLDCSITGPHVVINDTIQCTTKEVKSKTAGWVLVKLQDGHVVRLKEQFEYRPNPILESLDKVKTIIGGGIVLTVRGTNLDSVAIPKLTVRRIFDGNIRDFSEPCEVYNGEAIGCPTPDLRPGLPPQMIQEVEGPSNSRKKRHGMLWESLVRSRQKRSDPHSFNDDWQMQFHLGMELDGEDGFDNLTESMPELGQLKVYPDPYIKKFEHMDNVKLFDPSLLSHILIEGTDLDYAAEIHDYQALLGKDGMCNITRLITNAITCVPPTQEPEEESDWHGPKKEPRLRVNIGRREFFVGFLRYPTKEIDPVVVGVAAAIGVVFLLLTTTIMCYCHRKRLDQRDKNLILQHPYGTHQGNLYSNGMPPPGGYMRPRTYTSASGTASTYSGSSRLPLFTSRGSTSTGSPPPTPGAGSTYSEPMTPTWQNNVAYHLTGSLMMGDIMDEIGEDLRLTLQECKIDPDRLQLGHVIGQGHFGMVYAGELMDEKREKWSTVAVKTIQGKTGTVQEVTSFLEEAVVMKDFNHPNVLSLLGVVVEENKPYVILPFMEYGDLKTYISDASKKITVRELVAFGVQVADGMRYLTEQKFVHRDLATRNCMINKSLIVKIADFGLSRDIYKSDYYRLQEKHRPLPVKWMAIESLQHGVFSTKSDVWSFGVLLWELLTRGCGPYPDIDAFSVKKYLLSGRRLSQPEHAPDEVYAVMSSCWKDLPEKRPSFTQLHKTLKNILNDEGNVHPNYLKLI